MTNNNQNRNNNNYNKNNNQNNKAITPSKKTTTGEIDIEKTIKENKLAISTGDYIHNGVGIGAPVFDYTSKLVASIGIIGTTSRINKNNIEKMSKTVSNCAKELSNIMGYVGQN